MFSRSDLRRAALARTVIEYHNPLRPRVKRWSECSTCETVVPTYLVDIDHISPVIPVLGSFEDMSLDEFVDRLWCDEKNLAGLCETCHDSKTKWENKQRRDNKKKVKNGD